MATLRNFSRPGRFLEAAPSAPNQNVLAMVRLGLRAQLRLALKKSATLGQAVETPHLSVDIAGGATARDSVLVEPVQEPGAEPLYLIVFNETPPAAAVPQPGAPERLPETDAQLEAELRDAREQLQAITEDHVTALEDLRSANEELHSVNEELPSTDEELETCGRRSSPSTR